MLEKEPKIIFCEAEYASTVADLKLDKTTVVLTDKKVKVNVNCSVNGALNFEDILKGEEGIVDLTEAGPRDVLIVLQGERTSEDIVLTNETLLKQSTRKKQFK